MHTTPLEVASFSSTVGATLDPQEEELNPWGPPAAATGSVWFFATVPDGGATFAEVRYTRWRSGACFPH